jgi:TetR/AcrR family transcriptional regulator, transcriptional repressor for nem operon
VRIFSRAAFVQIDDRFVAQLHSTQMFPDRRGKQFDANQRGVIAAAARIADGGNCSPRNVYALIAAVVQSQSQTVLDFQSASLSKVDSLQGLRLWRDQLVELNRRNRGIGGCPMGSLASELAERSEPTRTLLDRSFREWESHIATALETMQDLRIISRRAAPRDLAIALVSALQGGLLLAQTSRSSRPLELALDMAIDHIASYRI